MIATVAAVASVAYLTQSIAHELIGHGTGCLLSGGKLVFVDSIAFRCTTDGRLVEAGGPAANLAFGFVSYWAFRRRRAFTLFGFFLWLMAAINLLMAGVT